MPNYIAYFDRHKDHNSSLISTCMDNPDSLECLPSFGLPMTRYDIAAGYEGLHNFKIAILRFITTNVMADRPDYMQHLAWESEFESYNRLKKKELMANGTQLYFRAHQNLHFITPFSKNHRIYLPVLMTCFFLQFVYMVCIFQNGRIILPGAILFINLCSISAACGVLLLFGFDAPHNLMEILPCIVLAIGADNMIILVITENCEVEKPLDVTNVSYLRTVLWEVVPATRCNNISLLTCSLFAFFSENAQAAALALYVAITVSVNFILEETCFMAILLLESRRRSSMKDCFPFPTYKLPIVLNPDRKYFDNFVNLYYLPLLTARVFQVIVIVVSMAMICFSLNLYYFIAIGEDMERFRSTDPDVREFYEFERENSVIGHPVYFVITGGLDFSDEYNRKLVSLESDKTESIYHYINDSAKFSRRSFIMVDDLSSWSDDMYTWLNTSGCCRIQVTDQEYCSPSDQGKL